MSIAPDKKKHFVVGILMGIFLQFIASHLWPEHYFLSIFFPFVAIVLISYGFELFSLLTKKGHYEMMDAIVSIVGGIIGMGIILLV